MLMLLPLLLLAACAAPGGLTRQTPTPTQIAAAPTATPTDAAASAPAAAASAPAAETDVAAAPVPIDPLRPDVRMNLDDRAAQTDLWARVRSGFAIPDLDNTLVRAQEQWYVSRPDYVQRMTERGGRYLFHIVEELQRRDMPTELALLPFIESAFNPQAMSSARASGMWQFIPSTGKHFDLKQNVFRDDRRDVLASTRAALDYLQKLHGMFGDWQLALAAYNWGEGNVQRAIARNQKLGLPTDYSSLKMPAETQNYVPKLQAVKNIVAHPADFGLTLPPLQNHPYFLAVPIDRDMDVAVAVKLAGMPLADFQTLNPQMNKPVILAAGTPQVLLPYDNANQFVRELPLHRGPLASWTAWVAPKTLRPADAAKRVGMSEAQLREINRIPPRMLVKAGSTLLVPRSASRETDVSSEIADNATMSLAPDAPPLRRMWLKAGRKDSVASVARRYRVSALQVAEWNQVGAAAAFKPGQRIVVFVASKASHRRLAHALPHRRGGHAAAVRTAAASPAKIVRKHGRHVASKTRMRVARS
ncbi:MAG: transglycosylase SLT domain-containing protein [Burkholderiales bacterium]|nr:transglycosylase SLT domain-containing protein [Burkholderiales bacterium]MDE2298789.1 transglycosylase SLT domain-containing protein [Burkholderiales bacterium]MDE2626982.1 transglycosylase SLT domain-containing protein [Burkholderiales bacterium]